MNPNKKVINVSFLLKENKELQQRIEEHKQEAYKIKKNIETLNYPKQPNLKFLKIK